MRERLIWFYWLLFLAVGILGARLLYLQIFEVKYYRTLADENRVRLKVLPAQRGEIVDRFGEILTLSEANVHVLGYTGEANEEEADKYYLGAVVGKTGLEKQYDRKLRGVDGVSILEQDSQGKMLRELRRIEPIKGEVLPTTLDAGLQKKAYELLDKRKGAVVAGNPNTGEILALVSSPGFEVKNLAKYLDDKDLPLFNRALGGEYPPGSVFKVVTATAALEEGKIDETTKIEDTGELRVGQYRFGNWYFDQYGRKEGWLEIKRALARSNDIFFYKLGEALGINSLADWARYFGLGIKTGIDLEGEAKGLMPDERWKETVIKDNWYLGDTYISAIGQGNVLMTPLQVNQMMGVIASAGRLCRPHLAKSEIRNPKSEKFCKQLDISKKTIDLITEGLKQVAETGGTAWPFFDRKVSVAGKTGTAEFGPSSLRSSGQAQTHAQTQAQTHAWFTGFAPVEQPEIAVTVLLEAAGEGSYQAAPVAKELLSYWFERQ